MKLALGTAQFGSQYGISNTKGRVEFNEQNKIIKTCLCNNIDFIDTAVGYGNCEVSLGELGVSNFKVITKIPELNKNKEINRTINQLVINSLENLKIDHLYAILLHNPKDLNGKWFNLILSEINKLKLEGKIKKFGISIYGPEDLINIKDLSCIDIVQAPLNVIDRRLIRSGWLKKLNKNRIEIHVRSAFLQGLLLMEKKQLPKNFHKWKKLWDNWEKVQRNGFSKLSLCINYINSIPEIHKIIIGVQNNKQLIDILKVYNNNLVFPNLDSMECNDINLINPMNWSN